MLSSTVVVVALAAVQFAQVSALARHHGLRRPLAPSLNDVGHERNTRAMSALFPPSRQPTPCCPGPNGGTSAPTDLFSTFMTGAVVSGAGTGPPVVAVGFIVVDAVSQRFALVVGSSDPEQAVTGTIFVGGNGNVTYWGWDNTGCINGSLAAPAQNLCVGPTWEFNTFTNFTTDGGGGALYGWSNPAGETLFVDAQCNPFFTLVTVDGPTFNSIAGVLVTNVTYMRPPASIFVPPVACDVGNTLMKSAHVTDGFGRVPCYSTQPYTVTT